MAKVITNSPINLSNKHSISKAKLLGQYYTPSHITNFILSGLNSNVKSILDPMAGNGIFLLEAKRRFPHANIFGVELDKDSLKSVKPIHNKKFELIESDIFSWTKNIVEKEPQFHFSTIVGNPAYVSYQNLNSIPYFSKNLQKIDDYKSFLLDTLKIIAKQKGKYDELSEVFRLWSGLSDLNAYTLILAWLLIDEGGQIGFVISNHWMERDYGKIIKHFLATNGTIRGIVTHRLGNWFPNVQIPTSIMIYTKGNISDRQNSFGVPYVEIDASYTDNIELFLKSKLKKDFWMWLDSVSNSSNYGPIKISFRKWVISNKHLNTNHSSSRVHTNLTLPNQLEKEELRTPENFGWSVHQGLRTGCNEVFYVKRLAKNNKYQATLTKNKKKYHVDLIIPKSFLYPTIRHFSKKNSLIMKIDDIITFLLNLKNTITQKDKKNLEKYPEKWREYWNIQSLEIIPDHLSNYLIECENMEYEGKGNKRKLVTDLSAIKPNIYEPPLNYTDRIPNGPRFWYQIPIQKRHFGEIIVPRISSGPLRVILVKQPEKIIIDANFLTVISHSKELTPERFWFWLNSNTFRLICETNGVALGGGALKIEAALLSKIPIPSKILSVKNSSINVIKEKLSLENISDEKLIDIGCFIDSEIFDNDVADLNVKMLKDLVRKRQNRL